jgi:hypothetical protein
MTETVLIWEGPYHFDSILCSEEIYKSFNESGVYLWIDKNQQNEVYYVGKATGSPSLSARLVQHYMGYIGGRYTMPYHRFDNRQWSLNIKNKNVLETILSEDKFIDVVSAGFKYVRQLEIYLSKQPREIVNRLERNLLYYLKPYGTKWGTLTNPEEILNIKHSNAKWATKEVIKTIKKKGGYIETA